MDRVEFDNRIEKADKLSFEDYSQIGMHPNIQTNPAGGNLAVCTSWPFGDGSWYGPSSPSPSPAPPVIDFGPSSPSPSAIF